MSFNMNQVVLWVVWLTVIVTVVVAECPSGYTQRPNGNCYRVKNDKRHWWYYADKICKEEGAFLASIRNKAEGDWVSNFYGKKRSGGDHCNDWFWIGVNDRAREGHWRYTENGEPAWYGNWYWRQPDNYWKVVWKGYAAARNEDVVTVNFHTKKWNDETIDWVALCYVCEMYPRST